MGGDVTGYSDMTMAYKGDGNKYTGETGAINEGNKKEVTKNEELSISEPSPIMPTSGWGDPNNKALGNMTKAWGGMKQDGGFYGHLSPAQLYKKHQIHTTGRI